MAEQEDVTVTIMDDLSDVAHDNDRPRKLSEYKPTNLPLSKAEIEHDEARNQANDSVQEGWAPRTTENIGDMQPLPEQPRRS
jgi:hypothetical protein